MSRYFARLAQRSDVIAHAPRARAATAPTITEQHHEVIGSAPASIDAAPTTLIAEPTATRARDYAASSAAAPVSASTLASTPTPNSGLPLAQVRHDEPASLSAPSVAPASATSVRMSAVSLPLPLPPTGAASAPSAEPIAPLSGPERVPTSPAPVHAPDHTASPIPTPPRAMRSTVRTDVARPSASEMPVASLASPPLAQARPSQSIAQAIAPAVLSVDRTPPRAPSIASPRPATTHAVQVHIGKIELEVHAPTPNVAPKSASPAPAPAAPAPSAPHTPRFNAHRYYLRGG